MRHWGKIIMGSGVGLAFCLPDEYYPGKLKPVSHMLNVGKAGVKMGYVYYFSSENIEQKHRKASEYLRDALRESGGIYIKLGQLIATLDVIVPDEYRETMMSLTRGCETSTFSTIKNIIEEQMEKPLESIFQEFDEKPISSASIAQVHRARLITGEEVAVKIQHENLSENVKYDVELMWAFVKIAKFLDKEFKYEWLIDEFEKNIEKELDFRLEAKNMKRVETMLKKENFNNVAVPKLLLPPTQKTMVMEFIHGYHIDEIEKMKLAGFNLQKIGKTFSEVIIKMIHKYGFVHADPHSGNMLVRKDKNQKDQLVLLDHGLYQELDEFTREQYNLFWLGLITRNQEISTKAAELLGTKNGEILCSMLTSQTPEQLYSSSQNIFDLNPISEKKIIMDRAKEYHPEIVNVLNEIKRELLLLLKVNEFARSIENMLGGRKVGVYEDIAKCCVENLPLSKWQKWKYSCSMIWNSIKN